MKKVLIITSVASMVRQFLLPSIELLNDLGYSVEIATNFKKGNTCSVIEIENLKQKLDEIGVVYYQIDFDRNVFNIRENYKAFNQLKHLADNNIYEFINCHSPIGGALGRIVYKYKSTKVIYTAHGFHFFKNAPLRNWLIFYPIEKYLANFSDIIITINEEDYSLALNKFKKPNIEYIHGVGINIEKIINWKVNRASKLEKFGIEEDSVVLLSVGELNKNKNHETIIEALSNMKYKNWHYIICGQGELKDQLEKKCKLFNIENQVHFIGYRSDIIEIYKCSDIFVFPSFREGLSVSMMEAMSCNLPIICSDIRGNKDLVKNNEGGILLSPTDVKGFEHAIEYLCLNSDIREQYGCKNSDTIRKYDVNAVNKKLKEIYCGIRL